MTCYHGDHTRDYGAGQLETTKKNGLMRFLESENGVEIVAAESPMKE
jgi:hypothetical protein